LGRAGQSPTLVVETSFVQLPHGRLGLYVVVMGREQGVQRSALAGDRGPARLPFFSLPPPSFVYGSIAAMTEGTKQESVFTALHETLPEQIGVWEFRAGPSFGSGSPVAGRETFYMALA